MDRSEEIKKIRKKLSKLGDRLSELIQEERDECDHIFVSDGYWDHHDGWDTCDYDCGQNFHCEKCGISLKHKSLGNSMGYAARYDEYVYNGKVILKLDYSHLHIFDPILKTLKRRSEYKKDEIESVVTPGLRTMINEYYDYNTTEIVTDKPRQKYDWFRRR